MHTLNAVPAGGAVFPKFFSVDSAKAIKARKYGWLNAISYMAPHTLGGAGNLCGNASPACIKLCLGWYSGQSAFVSDMDRDTNSVRESRKRKSVMFQKARREFMRELVRGVERAIAAAARLKLKLCVRLNGSSDIPFEAILCERNGEVFPNVFAAFAEVQFVDYTKSVKRALRFARGQLPPNYCLTFSRSETNEADCLEVLEAGGNAAIVFGSGLPAAWNGYRVVNGDEHDLRHLDDRGVAVGLSPKGARARRDKSGFIVRSAA
jgi:hypothetical protein